MGLLRVVGFLSAALLLILALWRYRARSLRLPDALIMCVVALGLGVISVMPSVVDPLLRQLGFPPGNARRVLGVLVLSNLLTYTLLLRSFAKTDRLERALGDFSDRAAARWFHRDNGGAEDAERPRGKVAVVIPALNEQGSIAEVLGLIPKEIGDLEVEPLVVSDGSTDLTEALAARSGALVAGRDLRRGQGAAVALGYRLALARGAEVIATLDADGQYDPLELPQLIQPILDGEADVVHGSRMLGNYERPLFGRAQGIKVFSWLTTRITRTPITDPASGFRAFTPAALETLEFRENQFHASEVTVAAVRQGLRVKEVPCSFNERRAGVTKKPHVFRYGYGYTKSLLRAWLS
jgi:hypothetical protein